MVHKSIIRCWADQKHFSYKALKSTDLDLDLFNQCIQKKVFFFGIDISCCGNGKPEAVECNTLALDLLKNFATDLLPDFSKTAYTKGLKGGDFVGYSPFQIRYGSVWHQPSYSYPESVVSSEKVWSKLTCHMYKCKAN